MYLFKETEVDKERPNKSLLLLKLSSCFYYMDINDDRFFPYISQLNAAVIRKFLLHSWFCIRNIATWRSSDVIQLLFSGWLGNKSTQQLLK